MCASPSQWNPPQHDVDYNGYTRSPAGSPVSMNSNASRARRGSSPGKRALQWFTRSRSASPQSVNEQPPSPTSFVVRNVVRKPGGVSHDQGYPENASPYQKVRSQPLTSLSVPPGGPGGGTGYGTAQSSNDGRPEHHHPPPHQRLERGRSTSPSRPPSPGAIRAGAFHANRVSPGPLSTRQKEEAEKMQKRKSLDDRDASLPHGNSPSPLGPRSSPGFTSPSHTNPSTGRDNPNRFSMPVHIPIGSAPPPVIPLEGMPSPVKVPISPSRAGASPFGSASPAGSPGFSTHLPNEGRLDSGNNSPNGTSRWFKGIFGRSPRLEERDDAIYNSGQWMKQNALRQQNTAAWSDGSPLGNVEGHDLVEMEAAERKKQSMLMAARIEDEHRKRLIMQDLRQPTHEQLRSEQPDRLKFSSDQDWDPPQSRSPPGRKPPPRFSPDELHAMSEAEREKIAQQIDPENTLSRMPGELTPAQQIIAETRSKMRGPNDPVLPVTTATQVQRGFHPANGGNNDPKGSPQHEIPVRRGGPPDKNASASQERRPSATPSGLTAGSGPLPNAMPLDQALQEMMVRFYRFERYAVPLLRSLDGRLMDVERDNQMAINGDTQSANSTRDREMDRWVGQMTSLMRHEIGQLQAATKEIRGARDLLGVFAQKHSDGKQTEPKRPSAAAATNAPLSTSTKAPSIEDRRSASDQSAKKEHLRQSNFSSATFKSAVPPTAADAHNERVANNASPNGRPRYTRALGQPLQDGRLSPLPSPSKETSPLEIPPLSLTPGVHQIQSPAPSDISSSSRRAMSVDERLKNLVSEKVRSPSIATNESDSNPTSSMQGRSSSRHNDPDSSTSPDTSLSKQSAGSIHEHFAADPASMRRLQNTSKNSSKTTDTVTPQRVFASAEPTSPPSATTPTRQSSNSPALLPSTSSEDIKTSSNASVGLRARAQSYLQQADSSSSANVSASNSASLPPSPSPGSRVLGARDINVGGANPTEVRPLQIKKSTHSIRNNLDERAKPRDDKSLPSTPQGRSIKDRVAFFDAQRG